MGNIRILPDDLANQVAAGEVVERPASIVKELAENSLDAGATRIVIDFAKGGSRLVAIRDDGCGMDKQDALLSLERHATSKLRTASDLARVSTMGFRGEALPSIASVSRFRMVTREHGAQAGTEILVSGGRIEDVRDAGAPPGTLVEARDLFFNVPARRKFLRGEETEAAQILQVVHGFALSAPKVGVECRRDGREVVRAPAAASLDVRVRDLFGPGFLARMVAVGPAESGGIRLEGYVSKPGEGRRDRIQQFVIINGRPVTSPEISASLREACAGSLPPGLQPLCVLALVMPPDLVDCNAHPAKRQVRFARPEDIRRAVFDAVHATVGERRPRTFAPFAATEPPHTPDLPVRPEPARPVETPEAAPADHPTGETPPTGDTVPPGAGRTGAPPPGSAVPPERAVPPDRAAEPPPGYRILGSFGKGYFAMEGPEGLVILDVRAARERIAFEELLRQIAGGTAPCQRLLLPEVVELPAREHAWIVENLDSLKCAGFLIENFGGLSIKIDGVPALAGTGGSAGLLHEVAASLRAAGRLLHGHGLHEVLARAVTRCSRMLDFPEDGAARLVDELLRCDLPYASPAGNPTMIQFSFAELDRKFGRGGTFQR